MISDNQKFNKTIQPTSAFLSDLKIKLPEFFAEDGSFDIDKFKNQLDDNNINVQNEGYQLDFIGKGYARRQAGEMPTTVIVPDKKQNMGEGKNSKNLFFTGDNLEVLRHLQSAYTNKVDVIYIDPPYNTGSDGFVYPDKIEYSDDKLKEMFGIDEDQVEHLKGIQEKSSHSAWLTFMYPRLALAKRLLTAEGVMFVSIDDNEVEQLRGIMDEIFGETNFIAQMIIDGTPKNDPLLVATSHEYVLVYCKSKVDARKVDDWGYIHPLNKKINDMVSGKTKEVAERILKEFYEKNDLKKDNISNYKYFDDGGVYRIGPIDDPQGRGPKDIRINPLTGEPLKVPSRGWSCNIETWDSWKKQNLIEFPLDNKKLASKKTYLTQDKLEVGRSVLKMQTRKSTQYLNNTFGKKGVFKNPKPLELLTYLLSLHQMDKDMVVLDFFAGSATTADAVMQLNAEDGGHRKFIMVQLPEKTYKVDRDTGKPTLDKRGQKIPTKGGKAAYDAGFKSIDQISRERIRRAAKKIKQDNELTLPENFDGSFKHYRVVKPTKQILEDIENFDPNGTDLFTNMVDSFSSSKLNVDGNATGEQTILTTWLVQDGYSFEADIETFYLGEYKAHIVENHRLYLINEGWNQDDTKELLNQLGTHQLDLQSVVVFGYSFNIAELRELEIGLKQLDSHVNLIRRY
ncbi:site-specific DNA-methyltransferase [Levilactobacillus parabrevis]|uniref:site-specific DNA-methyltransferase n=1 Tax=Levilactobacillus parabrevis TaxID=357278 RepID=UPI0021A7AE80|nr:site-specific DNA-methyltransferase [Levilactobacillus parabrevis]MCT4489202.1 site-specific DNA-methyltransferase [Levilactobacillus parabrevis]